MLWIQILILLALGALIVLLALHYKKTQNPEENPTDKLFLQMLSDLRLEIHNSQGQNREELQKRMMDLQSMIHKFQTDSGTSLNQAISQNFQESKQLILDVTKNIGDLQSTNRQIVGFAEQMKSLENILKNPKQRGILGEFILESVLSSVLAPGQYSLQYKLENQHVVDAVIHYNDLLIPIDSKFSLEKYNQMMETHDPEKKKSLETEFKKDVKNRIEETSKYILPSKGTTEFAFMFIPAEGVYYNLLISSVGMDINSRNLIEFAFEKRVIIVSPVSFYAYLQTVMQGLKVVEMNKNVNQTIQRIELLGKHIRSFEDHYMKLGKHLESSVNAYNSTGSELKKMDKDVYRLTDGRSGGESEVQAIDAPHFHKDV